MDITRWSTPNQTDYILCSHRWRSFIQSAKTRPGVDCGSDHELLIAKFRLKWKKEVKIIKPFSYDLKQTLNNYTMEVTNRLKGSDVTDRVPEKLWTEVHNTVQEAVTKTIPKKKKCKKARLLSMAALQIAKRRREAKDKGEKERYILLNAEFQRRARRDKMAFCNEQYK